MLSSSRIKTFTLEIIVQMLNKGRVSIVQLRWDGWSIRNGPFGRLRPPRVRNVRVDLQGCDFICNCRPTKWELQGEGVEKHPFRWLIGEHGNGKHLHLKEAARARRPQAMQGCVSIKFAAWSQAAKIIVI